MVIYLASAIRPKGNQTLRSNINKAKYVALKLWEKGYTVICPAANTDLPSEEAHKLNLSADEWLNRDLEILKRCDAIFIVPDWELSEGVKGEILFARNNSIPIYYYPDMPRLKQKECK